MKLTELFLAELDREAIRTRRALEQVPLGRDDWKPHEKSMPLGRLAGLVASMPSWVTLIIGQDELDLTPPPGQGQYQQPAMDSLVETMDKHVVKARESLSNTSDEFLLTTNWRLRAAGRDGSAAPHRPARHVEPSRAPSRSVDRVSAVERSDGASYLWSVSGRSAVRVDVHSMRHRTRLKTNDAPRSPPSLTRASSAPSARSV